MDQAPSRAFCTRCDYPVTEVAARTCPECGQPFDPADPTTFSARPTARRRRWTRRAVYLARMILLVELVAPSRIARFTWTWPNADGATLTSETRWHLVAPRCLPIDYPRFTTARWKHPIPSGYVDVADYTVWRIGLVSVRSIEGGRTSCPPSPPRKFTFGGLSEIKPNRFTVIRPGNLDTIADMLLFGRDQHDLCWCPEVLTGYPSDLAK
jgi:hypothetical protein